jgi:hypothetical protein
MMTRKALAAALALCIAALAAGCGVVNAAVRDHPSYLEATEDSLMASDLDISDVRTDSDMDGFDLSDSVDIDSNRYDVSADELRTVLEIVIKEADPRTIAFEVCVYDPSGELIDLTPAYVALGFPDRLEAWLAAHPEEERSEIHLDDFRCFSRGVDSAEEILGQ